MFTDMVGYTALTQTNESDALKLLERHNQLLRPLFPRFNGREIKTVGDSFLVEFDSALDATNCAVEIQRFLHDYNLSAPPDSRIRIRIGIHMGDVVHVGGDVFGDSVNISSRIEPLADPGGICITEPVFGQVRNKIPNKLEKLEPQALKNVRFPLAIYRVDLPWSVRESPAAGSTTKRLAVLPFVNISPDPNDEFFADGLTEEMIARLSLLKGVEVIARTSVMNYKNKEKNANEIGKELGARTLLEGSVRKAGNRIRVTVQLIDSSTEGHLWAEKFDRNVEDIFAVQSEIAESVASSLQVQLRDEDRRRIEKGGTTKVEAYTLMLKGRFHLYRWDEISLYEAIGYFQKALDTDPNYAAAYAGLAHAYARLGFLDLVDSKKAYPKAEGYARKALQLDETLPEAHLALADAIWNTYDFIAIDRELKRALELDPSLANAHRLLAAAFAFRGKSDEAMREVEKMLELDPLSVETAGSAGTFYLYLRQYDKAIQHLKDAVELDPKNTFYPANLGLAHLQKGMLEEGLEEVKRAVKARGSPDGFRDLAYAFVKVGKPEEARELLTKLLQSSEKGHAHSVVIGGIYAVLGESENALDWLEKAYDEHSGYLSAIGNDFVFESLHDHPRFQALLRKMNLR
jgi:adenylate cyclase